MTATDATRQRSLAAIGLALGAIALWTTLAALAVSLRAVPPFLLVGAPMLASGLATLPLWRARRPPLTTLLLGIYGLFIYHLLLFSALRLAPPVEANLLNYLWPLLIVVLAPALLPGHRHSLRHLAGALLGLGGATLLITGGRWSLEIPAWPGYALAAAAAVVWSTYSLLTKRARPFPTATVGLFCLLAGALALACHLLFEPAYSPTGGEWARMGLLAVGPLGLAYFLWDAALKRGDPRAIGALAYLTPLGSTLLLIGSGQGALTPQVAVAALLILGGAALGSLPSTR